MLQSGRKSLVMVKDATKKGFDVCLSMSMYPPDKEPQNDIDCNVCGAPANMEHHPNCPVPAGEEIFIMDADIVNIMTNALAQSSMDYMKKLKGKQDELLATERFEQMQKDFLEIGALAQALYDVGKIGSAKDAIHFIRNTNEYEPYYLLWLELNRPQLGDETWEMFHKEVWNRIIKRKDADGQQTEDTGN